MMIISQINIKTRNVQRKKVQYHLHHMIIKLRDIITKSIVVVHLHYHHHHHHHHQICLNHVHKKRKELLIMINIRNIISRKNTTIDAENAEINLRCFLFLCILSFFCFFFFVWYTTKLKNNASKDTIILHTVSYQLLYIA